MINIPNLPYVLFFVLACGLLGLLGGLIVGARKKIAGISAIILSVIASMITIPILVNVFATPENVAMLVELIGFTKEYNEIIAISPSVADLIVGIPIALVAPIVFLPIYFVLRLFFRIIAGIVTKIIYKKKGFARNRLLGMPLGFVQGVLSAMVIVIVIAGYVNTVDNVTDTILAQESEQLTEIQATVSQVDQYLNIVADDPVIKILDKTNFVFDSLNSFKFDGKNVVLKNEISSITEAGVYLVPVLENTDFSTWTSVQYDALDAFVDKFGNSSMLPKLSSEVLSAACSKWADGEEFLGMAAPEADETINPLLVTLYATFKTSTHETIVVDLGTVVDILKIVGEADLLSGSASTDMLSKLNGDLISNLLRVISSNERFNILIPEVTNLGMRMLATALKLPANAAEVHANVTNSLSTDINKFLADQSEDSAAQLKKDVAKSLKSNGIDVNEDVAGVVADTMVAAFAEKETVSQEDVQKYFEDYANVYEAIESNNSTSTVAANGTIKLGSLMTRDGEPAKVYDYANMSYDEKIAALSAIGVLDYCKANNDLSSPSNMLANGVTADQYVNYILAIYNGICENYDEISALGAAEENPVVALKSPETIVTNKVTAEDLLVDSDAGNLSDEDIASIGEGFDNVVAFVDSYTKLEGDISLENISDLNLEAAGKALDLLQGTDLLGNSVGALADSLISEVTGSSTNVSDKIANSDASYESLMATIKKTTAMVESLQNPEISTEEKEATVMELLVTLTPDTCDVILDIVTVDFVISMGLPTESADAMVTLLGTALYEMARLPEEEHKAEAEKIKFIFEMTTIMENTDKEFIGEDGIFKTESEVADFFMDSKVARATLKAITTDKNGDPIYDGLGIAKELSDDDKKDVEDALVNYYNEKKTTAMWKI